MVEVRPVRSRAELDDALVLVDRLLDDPWGPQRASQRDAAYYRRRFDDQGDLQVVAIVDDRVVGAALASTRPGSDTAVVGEVAVAASMQRRGIGRALLDEVSRQAGRRGMANLALGADETVAGFYRACGFTPTLQITAIGPDRARLIAHARAILRHPPATTEQDDGIRRHVWLPLDDGDDVPLDELNAADDRVAFVMFTRRLLRTGHPAATSR